jgi:hypothetical protein
MPGECAVPGRHEWLAHRHWRPRASVRGI